MSPQIVNGLDPAPFREWCDARLRAQHGVSERPLADLVGDLARDLNLGVRPLYRWRFENKSLERLDLEDALHHAGVLVEEVYPNLAEWTGPEPGGPPPGFGSKLSDKQVAALHLLHTQGGLSIRELGRRIYRQTGYASPDAAVFGIRRGFRRLGLRPERRHALHAMAVKPERRCREPKSNGDPCGAFAMKGEEFCWPHHPDNRSEARRRLAAANEIRLAGASR